MAAVRCLLGDEMREEIESAGLHKVKGRDKPVQVYRPGGGMGRVGIRIEGEG